MKKSASVTLTVVAAVGLASCGRSRRDPCDQTSFNEMACQDAVRSGGYYYGGTWFPMMYRYPYPYYYDSYRTHICIWRRMRAPGVHHWRCNRAARGYSHDCTRCRTGDSG